MINIISGINVTFSKYKFIKTKARSFFENYAFTNQRNTTRSMITWYAYTFPEQQLLDAAEVLHIEHIYSKKRQEIENGLQNASSLESLGNKVLLEGSINIRASDYRFEDKKKIYSGKQRRGKNRDASKISEIEKIIGYGEFSEQQIINRNIHILDKFFDFLHNEDLTAISD